MLRVREFGGPDKGTRVSYEIKRKFTRATDFKGQYIKFLGYMILQTELHNQ